MTRMSLSTPSPSFLGIVRYLLQQRAQRAPRGMSGCRQPHRRVRLAGGQAAHPGRVRPGGRPKRRAAQRHRVAGPCRFLIRPGVGFRDLASPVPGRMVELVGEDFERLHGCRPRLLETSVDEAEHTGASFRGANRVRLGERCGRERQDVGRDAPETPKTVHVHALGRHGACAPGWTRALRWRPATGLTRAVGRRTSSVACSWATGGVTRAWWRACGTWPSIRCASSPAPSAESAPRSGEIAAPSIGPSRARRVTVENILAPHRTLQRTRAQGVDGPSHPCPWRRTPWS